MFEFLKKAKDENVDVIYAPIKGEVVPSTAVNDATFAEEMLGKGIGIIPSEGKVYAPFDGIVEMVFDTKHAISLVSEKGAEVLIHVGLDTVKLKGEHFEVKVEEKTAVKQGDLLLKFDREAITAAGYDAMTPVVICNTDNYKEICCFTGKQVEVGDIVMKLEK